MRAALFLLITLLSACSPRGDLLVAPDVPAAGNEIDVFVATSRRMLVGQDPKLYRSDGLTYMSRTIAVPPRRTPGTVDLADDPIDPETEFFATGSQKFAGRSEFQRNISTAVRARPRGSRDIVVYVHGFNNTFADGILRIAQLSNDLETPGVAVHYSWPSAANPLGYGYDRDSVLFARDGLETLLRTVSLTGAERVLVVAHSMGALLTMETLRQISIADPGWPSKEIYGVVLFSPDIDIDVFRSQAHRIDPLPERFAIFVSERDRALALSARLTGQTSRLGNIADIDALSELDVVLLDVSEFSSGAGHFTAANSPTLLALLRRLSEVDRAFEGDRAGRTGVLPGTVLTVQSATNILLRGGQ